MVWTLRFNPDAEADLLLIFDHLADSYISLGETPRDAARRASERALSIRNEADRILTAPFRGEKHDDLFPEARHLALGKASYWFVPDEGQKVVTVLAVFYGGQDERRRMLTRLLSQ